jgi:hypothetical protein
MFLGVRVAPEQLARVDALAALDRRTRSWVVRELLDRALAQMTRTGSQAGARWSTAWRRSATLLSVTSSERAAPGRQRCAATVSLNFAPSGARFPDTSICVTSAESYRDGWYRGWGVRQHRVVLRQQRCFGSPADTVAMDIVVVAVDILLVVPAPARVPIPQGQEAATFNWMPDALTAWSMTPL